MDTTADLTLHIPAAVLPEGFAHNVDIHDDSANWLAWGQLVVGWIEAPPTRPNTVGDLRQAMAKAGVKAMVGGADDRFINWVDYNDLNGPLTIPLPQKAMVDKDVAILTATARQPPGQRHYPLPLFYTTIFGGSPKVDLSEQELLNMGMRRLGEYVINECM